MTAEQIVLIDRTNTNGRVYASGLFMCLCEETDMTVSLKRNGVSYSGTESQMIQAETITKRFEREHGKPP